MVQIYRRAAIMVRGRLRSLLLFEILFRLFMTFAVFPLCRTLFTFVMRKTGFNCITTVNVTRCLKNPFVFAMLLTVLLIFTLTVMMELSCLIACLYSHKQHQSLSIDQILSEGFRDSIRLLRPRNWPMLFLTVLLVPITQMFVSVNILSVLHMTRSTALNLILKKPIIYIAIAYIIILIALYLFCITIQHVYVLENCSMLTAIRRAYRLNRKKRLRNFFMFVVTFLVFAIGGRALVELVNRFIQNGLRQVFTGALSYGFAQTVTTVLIFLTTTLPTIFAYALITVLYIDGNERHSHPERVRRQAVRKGARRINIITFYTVATVCILCTLLYDTVIRPVFVRLDVIEYVSPQAVLTIAHRGNHDEYDENTLSAFAAALDAGVDYIELDVQATKDGVILVNHDSTFERVYGVKRSVHQMTFEETRQLRSKKTGECPPTLDEVLLLCGNRCRYLIELKDNGLNPMLPIDVYQVLERHDALDLCRIQSFSYTMLRAFKQQAESVPCGYLLSLSFGEYVNLPAADFFSIEVDYVDDSVVQSIHQAGKDVYCWVANREKDMKRLISMNVDGIITDRSEALKTVLLQNNTGIIADIVENTIDVTAEESVETAVDTNLQYRSDYVKSKQAQSAQDMASFYDAV